MAEDAEVGRRTSSTIRSVENSPSDLAENAEVGDNGDGGDNTTVKRSLLFKKPNRPTRYLTSLRSDTDSALFTRR